MAAMRAGYLLGRGPAPAPATALAPAVGAAPAFSFGAPHGVHVTLSGGGAVASNEAASGGTWALVRGPPLVSGPHVAVFSLVRGSFLSLGVGVAGLPPDATSQSDGLWTARLDGVPQAAACTAGPLAARVPGRVAVGYDGTAGEVWISLDGGPPVRAFAAPELRGGRVWFAACVGYTEGCPVAVRVDSVFSEPAVVPALSLQTLFEVAWRPVDVRPPIPSLLRSAQRSTQWCVGRDADSEPGRPRSPGAGANDSTRVRYGVLHS